MIGTGPYSDDVEAEVAAMRETLRSSINQTTSVLSLLFAAGVLIAALFHLDYPVIGATFCQWASERTDSPNR